MAEGSGEQTAGGDTSTVFISYASQDAGVANSIVEALEKGGLRCWIAPRDVVPGEFYADAIVRAIDAAKVIVLALSKNAAASPHVLREVERASSKRHPVVSFRTDLAPLPAALEYFLNSSQWLDASATGIDRALPKLVDAVRRAVAPAGSMDSDNSAAATRSAAPPVRQPSATATAGPSRTVVALLAVTAVALAYFVVDKFWLSKHAMSGQTNAPLLSVPGTAGPAATAISEKSVAILPFTDMSEKKDQEYFSDGMAEEIIDLLVKIPDLRVPARTSSFYFKGKSEDIPSIAKRLMVAHVLEGSVRKSGNHLRVTAQLVRADNGYHLWSQTYDRDLDDVFKVQDDIAGAVVKALKVSLLGAATPHATPTSSTESYTAFLQARHLTDRDSPGDLDKAVALFQQSIAADPNYAPAHAWLAWCYERRVANGIDTDGVGYAKARTAAERAIALDPTLPEGYLTLGTARLQFEFDWAAAAEMTDKARTLDANNSLMLQNAGHLALATGTPAEAERLYRGAVEQDPLNMVPRRYLGKALYYGGRLAEAETTLRRIIELNPQFPAAHYFLGVVLLGRGDPKAALTAIEAEPDPRWKSFGLPLAYWGLDRRTEAHAELAALVAHSAGAEFQVAEDYAYMGQPDQAFRWLDQARERHDPGVIHVRADPLLQSLVKDRRYAAFLNRMKLPE